MDPADLWLLHLNPFFWEGFVFAVFGLLVAAVAHAVVGVPARLLDAA